MAAIDERPVGASSRAGTAAQTQAGSALQSRTTAQTQAPTQRALSLTDVEVGQSGVICGIAGERMQRMKLLDSGLTPGTSVTVTKVAPMGNPIEVAVRSYLLTLRKEEAALIAVQPVHESAPQDGMPRAGA